MWKPCFRWTHGTLDREMDFSIAKIEIAYSTINIVLTALGALIAESGFRRGEAF